MLKRAGIAVSPPVRKAILSALAERDETAEACRDRDGDVEPDPELRDTESVPLREDIHDYFARDVKPHVPDAWIDEEKTRVGYEIPITRHFFTPTARRALPEIEADTRTIEAEIHRLRASLVGEQARVVERSFAGDFKQSKVPLAHLVDMLGGATPSKEDAEAWSGTIPWVSPKDMKRRVISDSEDHVGPLALERSPLKLVPPPAVLVVVRGMILAHTFPVAETTAAVTINQDMKALRPRRGLEPRFLAWTLRAKQDEILSLVEEAGHGTKRLRTDLFRKLIISVPAPRHQLAIADALDRCAEAIEASLVALAHQASLLQEYRDAVIAAAVRGEHMTPSAVTRVEFAAESR